MSVSGAPTTCSSRAFRLPQGTGVARWGLKRTFMMTAARAAHTLLLMASTAVAVAPPSVEAAQDLGAAPGNGPARVAVFRFTNISQAAADDWIGAGIAETVASDLGGVAGLSVIGLELTGSAPATLGVGDATDGGNTTAMEVGRRLGAAWIVVGAYQRVGDHLRITARAVEVATARVVRTARIDGQVGDLFALQDQLGAQIRDGLAEESGRFAVSAASRVPTTGERTTPRDTRAPGVTIGTAETAGAVGFARPPGIVIDGPPPPVAPETISRNEAGGATIRAVRIQGLVVDGALDEAVYTTVPSFGGFIQMEPTAGAPATERTEAWVLFDDTHLYIVARVWDAAPESEWVVNEMRRDSSNLSQNEGVGILLDTYYDRRNGLFFTVSPIGGRADGEVSNERGYNRDWNPIWTVETGRFEGGWSFEAAFPFRSLRYRPGRSQVWGLQLRRRVRHKNETAFLTPLDPGLGQTAIFQVSRSATLVGLEVPARGRPIEIKPYLIGDVSSDVNASPAVLNAFGGNLGLDLVKYGVTENLTADFTVNTDFAQVEADEQQVNLTRFSLFFPEKREFFLENQGTFGFGGTSGSSRGSDAPVMFYSRRIGLNEGREVPIRAGGRLTGRVGKFSLGLLNIQTGVEEVSAALNTNFTVVRLKRDLLRRSSVGAIITNRSALTEGPGTSQTYGADAGFAFYENLTINTYWATTRTTGGAGQDTSYQGALRYNGDRYGVTAEHLFVDSQFSPAVGFVRRDDFRKSQGSVRFSPRPRGIEAVRKFTWEGSYDYITDAAGIVETREARGRFQTEFENSDTIEVSYTTTYDALKAPFTIAPGITIPVGGYDFWNARTSLRLGQQRRMSGSFFAEHGTFYGGTKTAVGFGGRGSFSGRIEVTPRFSLDPSLSLNWIDLPQGRFLTQLLTTRATYTINPAMFVSALVQYNSSNNGLSTNIRLRWEYQPGSELFIVYNEERDTLSPLAYPDLENRAFIVKINRLFRF